MSNTRLVIDCKTGEEFQVELSESEINFIKFLQEQAILEEHHRIEEEYKKEVFKKSAEEKLEKAGLTIDEIRSLFG